MPDLGAVNLSTFAAVDFAGKDALACGVATFSPFQLVLHTLESSRRDDGVVILFYIELRNLSVVFEPVFGEKIDAVGFLEELIAHVGFVPQDSGFDTMCAVGANGCKWVHGVGASTVGCKWVQNVQSMEKKRKPSRSLSWEWESYRLG